MLVRRLPKMQALANTWDQYFFGHIVNLMRRIANCYLLKLLKVAS